MQDKSFVIRTMQADELDIAIQWAAAEGWNPGLADKKSFFSADNKGYLLGLLDGKPIATISVVKYDESFGFLGFYIVKPDFRGQGYGIQIWKAGLEYLKGCNIGLDGVVDQQDNYKKSGFKLAYRNIRYQGVTGGDVPNNTNIINLSKLSIAAISNFDRQYFPAMRESFIENWVRQTNSHALGIVQGNDLMAYGVIRECKMGYKIGPLFADSFENAESLFLALKAQVKSNQPLFLDIPEPNLEAIKLVEKYNMTVSFETARMYTGTEPNLPINNIFGVTTFELG